MGRSSKLLIFKTNLNMNKKHLYFWSFCYGKKKLFNFILHELNNKLYFEKYNNHFNSQKLVEIFFPYFSLLLLNSNIIAMFEFKKATFNLILISILNKKKLFIK